MGIDLQTERCMSLAAAARTLPAVRGDKSPHPMTLRRWATKGIRSRSGKRILLETVHLGGTIVTSREALHRFFLRKDDLLDCDIRSPTTKKMNAKAAEAKSFLQSLGMLD